MPKKLGRRKPKTLRPRSKPKARLIAVRKVKVFRQRNPRSRKTTRKHKKPRQGRKGAMKSYKEPFLAAMMNPITARGFRYKDEACSYPTGAISLHETQLVQPFAGNSGAYTNVPAGAFQTFLFRDPLRSSVSFFSNPADLAYSYSARFYTASTLANQFYCPNTPDPDRKSVV